VKRRTLLTATGAGVLTGVLSPGLQPASAALPQALRTDVGPVSSRDVWRRGGLNTKSSYGDGTVYMHTDALASHVTAWGGAYLREVPSISGPAKTRQGAFMRQMEAADIGWMPTLGQSVQNIAGQDLTDTEIRAYARQEVAKELTAIRPYASMLHSVEGPNEVDNPSNTGPMPGGLRKATLFVEVIHELISADSDLSGMQIFGCSTRTDIVDHPELAEALSGCGPYVDGPNAHLYVGRPPTDDLDRMLRTISVISPGRAMFSEGGYNNAGFDANGNYIPGSLKMLGLPVPESVAASYGPRATLEYFNRDAHFTKFEALDDPDPTGRVRQAHFGLVAMTRDTVAAATPDTWRRKPEHVAMAKLNAVLKGGTSVGATLDPLSLRIDAPPDVKTLLMRRPDGHYLLAVWRDVSLWHGSRADGGFALPVSNETVSVYFGTGRTLTTHRPSGGAVLAHGRRRNVTLPPLGADLQLLEIVL